jgi:deoxyadenosine/deoxycytidine kinase
MSNEQMNLFNVVSIDGNIGSGKSTLMANLREHYKDNVDVVFLKEPVDEWAEIKDENGITILEKFYEDSEKYAFSFQMMAYISRLKVLKDVVKNIKQTSKKTILISERSLYTDKMVFAKMLYDSKKIEDINYQIYLNWFDTFSEEFPVHKVIYVKTEPEKCHSRILKRAREGENLIPLEYLKNCDEYHDNMLNMSSTSCICKEPLILDANVEIYEKPNQIKEWISEIDNFIKN